MSEQNRRRFLRETGLALGGAVFSRSLPHDTSSLDVLKTLGALGLRFLNRKDQLRGVSLGAAGTTGSLIDAIDIEGLLARRPKERIFLDVFGVHDTPKIGGSQDYTLAASDMTAVNAKNVLLVHPTRQLAQAVSSKGIIAIHRAWLDHNRFNETAEKTLAEVIANMDSNDVLQIFNEVNQEHETGGAKVTPEDHVENDLLPALDQALKANIFPLITAMAPRYLLQLSDGVAIYEDRYWERTFRTIAARKGQRWARNNLGISIHPYTYTLDENPTSYVREIDNLAKSILGGSLPLYGTEAGLYMDRQAEIGNVEIVAADLLRMLLLPIPKGIEFRSFNLWVLSNFAQRPLEDRTDTLARRYEVSAIRREDGPTAVYRMLERVKKAA